MFVEVISLYFEGQAKGIILDNAYDVFVRNQYLKYIEKNSINYLRCQDVDMSLLNFFSDIEFITVPEDAENLEELYKLKKLKGLEISARNLAKLDLACFKELEYLVVSDYSKENYSLQSCIRLKHLYLIHSNITSLKNIVVSSKLETIHLDFCYDLKTLDGIQSFANLNKLVIDYCLKLNDVSSLKNISDSIKYLSITDCNKIQGLLDVLSQLTKLETLHLATFQTNRVNYLESIKFIESFHNLKSFMTDYNIKDGDLTPLTKIKEVNILKSYKHYNLKLNFENK